MTDIKRNLKNANEDWMKVYSDAIFDRRDFDQLDWCYQSIINGVSCLLGVLGNEDGAQLVVEALQNGMDEGADFQNFLKGRK